MMKRIFSLLFSALVAMMLYAEIPPYMEYDEAPSFLHSQYKECHQPVVLKMQSSVHLMIDKNNEPAEKKIREMASSAHPVIEDICTKVDEKSEDATFEIKVDPDSVYDYSYKIYTARFEGCTIKYTTYFEADQLSVVLNHKEYVLSCLDGGMDVHIKYLLHKYTPQKEGEKLCIHVTEDLPLAAADKSTILLKKGSSFCFDIVGVLQK